MDKRKNKVGKSKSSNNPIATSSDPARNDKKSRSNAEIKPHILKKRGVYVEKSKTPLNPQDDAPKRLKCPRPRKTGFLTSALAILSKPTTGTQFPDSNEKVTDRSKYKMKKNKEYEGYIIEELNSLKKKTKYKSKVLNKMSEQDQIVVLQSKRNISRSSVNFSERSSKVSEVINWAEFLPPLVNKRESENNTNTIKDKMIRLLDNKEPTTMVGEQVDTNENKIYNFFVDLIESTFDMYNVNTAFDGAPVVSNHSSKATLEIDETVAKKLSIKIPPKDSVYHTDGHRYPRNYYNITPHENITKVDEIQLSPKPKFYNRPEQRKRKLKSSSFYNNKRLTEPIPKSNSFQNKWNKRNPKKNLLNLLKEELRTDFQEVVETQNFFEALKQMAENKRRNRRAIAFDESAKRPSEGDVFNCMFRRRGILSSDAKYNKKPNNPPVHTAKTFRSHRNISPSSRRNDSNVDDIIESRHSLKVYGIDYKNPKKEGGISANVVDTSSFSDLSFGMSTVSWNSEEKK